MDGTRLLIEAVTRTQADGDHRRGVEQIVEPIRFEYELSHSPFLFERLGRVNSFRR
jgi:hypothetical protein